jgi:glutaredoxin
LNAHSVKFTDYNVATDLEKRKEMIDKTGQMGVPVIDIDGEIMVGFEESRLAQLVGIK